MIGPPNTFFFPRSPAVLERVARRLWTDPAITSLDEPDPDNWLATSILLSGRQITEKRGEQKHGTPYPNLREPPLFSSPTPDSHNGTLPVSILICTFNRAPYLEGAIQSALAQRGPTEIIVVDDGSTDETTHILRRYPQIKSVRQANGGKPVALNHAISLATGDALLVLDDDDRLFPGAVSLLRGLLEQHPEVDGVWGDTIRFTETGRLQYVPSSRLPASMQAVDTLHHIPAWPGAFLVRRDAQLRAGLYDERLVRGQDIDMFQRLARVAQLTGVALPVFWNRLHEGLRGKAGDQWTPAQHQERFFQMIRPVFLERYHKQIGQASRSEAHDWALGLMQRGLQSEAVAELLQHEPPWSLRELWVRQQAGLSGKATPFEENLVVVDEGPIGVREELLAREGANKNIYVTIETELESMGSCQLHWPGNYVMHGKIPSWVSSPGPVHLRWTRKPDWQPPPFSSASAVPNLPVIALCERLTEHR